MELTRNVCSVSVLMLNNVALVPIWWYSTSCFTLQKGECLRTPRACVCDFRSGGLLPSTASLLVTTSRCWTIVWTYGHFASRRPVLYVFCCLLQNTSKIRPFSELEGRGYVFCPKAAQSSNLDSFFGAHLCDLGFNRLIWQSYLSVGCFNQTFQRTSAVESDKVISRTFIVFSFLLSKILKNTWFLTHWKYPYSVCPNYESKTPGATCRMLSPWRSEDILAEIYQNKEIKWPTTLSLDTDQRKAERSPTFLLGPPWA